MFILFIFIIAFAKVSFREVDGTRLSCIKCNSNVQWQRTMKVEKKEACEI